MSATVASATANNENEEIPLTTEQLAHNDAVEKFFRRITQTAEMEIKKDFKTRQIPDGMTVTTVYSDKAAKRTDINSLATLVTTFGKKKVLKLKFTASKTKNNSGFTIPDFVLVKDIMTFMGIHEGQSPLWPQGGKPVMSTGILTSFIGHYATAHNLANADNAKEFHADATLHALLAPFVPLIDAEPPKYNKKKDKMVKAAPINLQKLEFPTIQKFAKYFIQSSKSESAKTNGSANLKTNTEDGKILHDAFKVLSDDYVRLRERKAAFREALAKLNVAKEDFESARLHFEQGMVPEACYRRYGQFMASAQANYDAYFKAYADDVEKTIGLKQQGSA
tara:strand:- start:75792 stop:76799 length:1008 start_codon:yes stop_codon:yes gene_type:complete